MSNQISIVIVTYNSSKYIGVLLKSLIQESQIISEIVIIENNSPDKKQTQQVINQFTDKYKDLKIDFVISKKNDGFAKSCNKGARISKGQHILFLNPDTIIRKGSLHILMSHLTKQNANIIGGKVEKINQGKHYTVVRKPNLLIGLFEFTNLGKILHIDKGHRYFYYLDDSRITKGKKDVQVDAVGGSYLLISRSSFNQLRGFDEQFFMYLEDVDLGVRAKQIGLKVIYCPHSSILHEGGASSKNKYKIFHQAWYDSRRRYYRKHFGMFTNVIIQPIFIIEELLLKLLRAR